MPPKDLIPRWRNYPCYRTRRDSAGERTVEVAIELQCYVDSAYAEGFLEEHGIEKDVADRVLNHPHRRRRVVL